METKCKVCNTIARVDGFCKYHYSCYVNGKIDHEGKVNLGYCFDSRLRVIKLENKLTKIKETPWYRNWRNRILKRDMKTCCKCGVSKSRVIVHHLKRLSDIKKEAVITFPNDISEQLKYLEEQHTDEIGITLCLRCHAEYHKGEKVYQSLIGRSNSDFCKVCGKPSYCKDFCRLHYQRLRSKIINEDGIKIRNPKLSEHKGICIVCGKESVGRGGNSFKFCKVHLSRLQSKMIDIDGKEIRKVKKQFRCEKICKVCGEKAISEAGFCQKHYNRFKIGQIDENGREIRKLSSFCKKGDKRPRKLIEFKGKTYSLRECAELVGISIKAMTKRLKNWSIERSLTEPKNVQNDRSKK